MPPNVTVTGAGPEYDNLQPIQIPDIKDEEPTIDQMQYALNAPKPQAQPAPEPEPEKYVMAGRGVRVKPFENIVGPSITEGLIPTLYGAATGTAAGVAGLPGGVNELLREYVVPHLPQAAQNFLGEQYAPPTAQEIQQHIPSISNVANLGPEAHKTENAANWLGQNVTSNLVAPETFVGGAIEGGKFLRSAAADRIMRDLPLIPGVHPGFTNPHIMSAVKEKGGNWLHPPGYNEMGGFEYMLPIEPHGDSGRFVKSFPSEEAYIKSMEEAGYDVQQINEAMSKVSMNKWLHTKLKKYFDNEMGTPNDPVRQLADEGIHHRPLDEQPLTTGMVQVNREKLGYPKEGYAKTPLGQQWEKSTDTAITPRDASIYQKEGRLESRATHEPWINKLDPNTPVFTRTVHGNDLGIDHIVDELYNSMLGESGNVPQHLQLRPKDVEKMTVPEAVRHVHKINEYRAAQMDKTTVEGLKQFPVQQEYPDGFKWYELKMPENVQPHNELPKGYSFIEVNGNYNITGPNGKYVSSPTQAHAKTKEEALEIFNKSQGLRELDKALKNEGDLMGHCVGGYTDRVANGTTRIFTLRDPKGRPHVTIEASPGGWRSMQDMDNATRTDFHKWLETQDPVFAKDGDAAAQKYMQEKGLNVPMDIQQIKGKQNGDVNTKYLPYVKDLMNRSNIGRASDLGYADLVDTEKQLRGILKQQFQINGDEIYDQLKAANPNLPRFIHNDELHDLLQDLPSFPSYKAGGHVHMNTGGVPPTPNIPQTPAKTNPNTTDYVPKRPVDPGFAEVLERVRSAPKGSSVSGGGSGGGGGLSDAELKNKLGNRNITYNVGGKVTPDQMRYELLRKK